MVYRGRVLHGHARPVFVRAERVRGARLGGRFHQRRARLAHRRRVSQLRADFHPCQRERCRCKNEKT